MTEIVHSALIKMVEKTSRVTKSALDPCFHSIYTRWQGVINTSKLAHAHLLFGWFWISQYLTLAQRPYWRLPTNILVKFNARACPNVHNTHRGELILQSTGFAGYSIFLLKNSRTILLSFPVRRRALQNYTDLPASVYRDHCKITFDARERNYNSALLQHTTRERDGWL
jgi:hypothetical protein